MGVKVRERPGKGVCADALEWPAQGEILWQEQGSLPACH